MTSFRWTLVFGVLIAALIAFTVYDTKKSEKENVKKEEDSKVVHLKQDNITGLDLVSRVGHIKIEKTGDDWKIAEPFKDRGDQPTINTLISAICSQQWSDVVVEGKDVNWATYGLDHPTFVLQLMSKDGQKETVQIGSVTAFDGNLYAQVDKESKVLLVSSLWDAQLSKPFANFRDKHLVRSDFKVARVRVHIMGDHPSDLTLIKKGDEWTLLNGDSHMPVSTSAVDDFIDQVKGLRGLEIKSPSDMSGSLKMEIELGGSGAQEKVVLKVSSGKAKQREVLVSSTDLTAPMSASEASTIVLAKRPEDFYNKRFPFQFNTADVGRIAIDVGRDEKAIHAVFNKKDLTWVLVNGKNPDSLQREPDSAKLNELLGKIGSLEAMRFLGAKTALHIKQGGESSIRLFKANGEALFEMNWGEPVVENAGAKGDVKVEARVVPVKTSTSPQAVGLTEGAIEGLGLKSVLKSKANAALPIGTAPSINAEGKPNSH